MKDLAWTDNWFYTGIVFAIAALVWSTLLLARTILLRNWLETLHHCAQVGALDSTPCKPRVGPSPPFS
jgi:hypothetical protein